MKVLWLINIVLPAVCKELGIKSNACEGWIEGAAASISQEHELHIISLNKTEKVREICKDNIYYHISPKGNAKTNRKHFKDIIEKVNPEIVHIWGTEYSHTLDMVTVCEQLGIIDKVVISIQGLCSFIAKHYIAGLPHKTINGFTLRDILKRENIKKQQKDFEIRGALEIEALKKVKHVIGRTDWDKACVTQINPYINYHFCNETLRKSFYNHKWEYEKCEKHSVFVSQGHYPLKGIHMAIKAIAILKKDFPDVHLYVGGADIINKGLKISSYGVYIKKLIKKLGLENSVSFVGQMDEEKMRKQFLKANVFVLPSAIENSPNSLGEAMLLGVPSVASDVGGVESLFTHKEHGYIYPFDEYYMLAYYIKQIFENTPSVMTESAGKKALETHNPEKNTIRLTEIYEQIRRLS